MNKKNIKKEETPSTPQSSIKKEILGLLIFAAGIFTLVALYWPSYAGTIGELTITKLLRGLFGFGSNLFPYLLLLLGIIIISGKNLEKSQQSIKGVSICLLSFVTFWDIFCFSIFSNFSLIGIKAGGGLIGRTFNYLLHWLGIAGAYIVIGTFFIISIMLIFDVYYQKIKEWKQEKKEPTIKKIKKEPIKKKTKSLPDLFSPKEKKTLSKNTDDLFLSNFNINNKSSDGYQLPPLNLLEKPDIKEDDDNKLQEKKDIQTLESTLKSFNVKATVVNVSHGPAVTRYELEPGHGVRISKIANLADDISLSLASTGVRIEAPIPGKSVVGVEIPNKKVRTVTMFEVVTNNYFQRNKSPLLCVLGKNIDGQPEIFDLAKMPHILIAGATGSGKSVCINTLITSLLLRNKPDEVKFLMIDPKKVELSIYNGIPHLLTEVVTDPKLAASALKNWAIKEMERRYETFSNVGVKNIEGYNNYINQVLSKKSSSSPPDNKENKPIWDPKNNNDNDTKQENKNTNEVTEDIEKLKKRFQPLPYIIVIIDELADLMMVASSDVESSIIRLAQLARATGIHLVVATQRPSVNVITGLIKANIPSRVSFAVSSQIDSRTILDTMGAEKLLGRGDMLYSPVGVFKPKRLQGVYLSEDELNSIVSHVKKQAKPEYNEELDNIESIETEQKENTENQDPLFEEARQTLKNTNKPSISYLQRRLRIGYNRAARIFEELEEKGEITRDE